MDAQAFWNVIGDYNAHTVAVQAVVLLFVALSAALSYLQKVNWLAKFALGLLNLFICIAFFAVYGTEPVQKFFALPLYLLSGSLLIYESWRNRSDILRKPDKIQTLLLVLYLLYPLFSLLLGRSFPMTVTYIMPCPAVSLSIAVYSGYRKKNLLLLILLTMWGLTGVKSVIFNAYEDLVLLLAGIYGIVLIYREINERKAAS